MMIVTKKRIMLMDNEGNSDDSDGSSLLLSPGHHEASPLSMFCYFCMTVIHL